MKEFSSQNLLSLLDEIKKGIVSGNLSVETQENIWGALIGPVDRDLVKYLFTGWWIHQSLAEKMTAAAAAAGAAGGAGDDMDEIERLRSKLPATIDCKPDSYDPNVNSFNVDERGFYTPFG